METWYVSKSKKIIGTVDMLKQCGLMDVHDPDIYLVMDIPDAYSPTTHNIQFPQDPTFDDVTGTALLYPVVELIPEDVKEKNLVLLKRIRYEDLLSRYTQPYAGFTFNLLEENKIVTCCFPFNLNEYITQTGILTKEFAETERIDIPVKVVETDTLMLVHMPCLRLVDICQAYIRFTSYYLHEIHQKWVEIDGMDYDSIVQLSMSDLPN